MSVLAGSALGATHGSDAFASGQAAAKPTVVTVTLAKPSEFVMTLNKYSNLPVGKVIFQVTNRGNIAHDFKLCTKPVWNADADRCLASAGVSTKPLAKGQSQTVVVTLKKGAYEVLSTLPGHSKNGMKGLVGVGVRVTAPTRTTQPPEPRLPPVPGSCDDIRIGGSTVVSQRRISSARGCGATCRNPVATTVTVDMTEYFFNVSQWTVPCGTVTFVQRNLGTVGHTFSIAGYPPGAIVPPGGTASVTITFNSGSPGRPAAN